MSGLLFDLPQLPRKGGRSMHTNQFLKEMEILIAEQQLQDFIPNFSEIHLARVDEHTCLTGGGKR